QPAEWGAGGELLKARSGALRWLRSGAQHRVSKPPTLARSGPRPAGSITRGFDTPPAASYSTRGVGSGRAIVERSGGVDSVSRRWHWVWQERIAAGATRGHASGNRIRSPAKRREAGPARAADYRRARRLSRAGEPVP